MNFQESHKAVFNGSFGKPKHLHRLLLTLSECWHQWALRKNGFGDTKVNSELESLTIELVRMIRERIIEKKVTTFKFDTLRSKRRVYPDEVKFINLIFERMKWLVDDKGLVFVFPHREGFVSVNNLFWIGE